MTKLASDEALTDAFVAAVRDEDEGRTDPPRRDDPRDHEYVAARRVHRRARRVRPRDANAVLDHMGGVEGITRPTVAPAMSSGDKAIWIAKVSEIVLEAAATGKGAKRTFEFATPARFVVHLESGRTYDTTAWPVLGGT